VQANTKLQQKTKDYYTNGWRLLEGTEVVAMRLTSISRDEADRLTFPGGPGNQNNALRTLRRMLGKAEEWNVIKAAPKIKLAQEKSRQPSSMLTSKPSFCLSVNSRFAMC
jgi:hypothetical protein